MAIFSHLCHSTTTESIPWSIQCDQCSPIPQGMTLMRQFFSESKTCSTTGVRFSNKWLQLACSFYWIKNIQHKLCSLSPARMTLTSWLFWGIKTYSTVWFLKEWLRASYFLWISNTQCNWCILTYEWMLLLSWFFLGNQKHTAQTV